MTPSSDMYSIAINFLAINSPLEEFDDSGRNGGGFDIVLLSWNRPPLRSGKGGRHRVRAVAELALLRSRDSGAHWSEVPLPPPGS